MTPETRDMLAGWLESGTDAQRAHARHRLAMPDTGPARDAPAAPPMPPMPAAAAMAALRAVRRCPWRSRPSCGCQAGRCAIRGADVPDRDCLDCVARYGES